MPNTRPYRPPSLTRRLVQYVKCRRGRHDPLTRITGVHLTDVTPFHGARFEVTESSTACRACGVGCTWNGRAT
jgi:hypothetical protein